MLWCRCVSAFRCTIFTAIYGFEGFVNIILMFNETIINQIVCESKIATMTFFPLMLFSPCFDVFPFFGWRMLGYRMQLHKIPFKVFCCCYYYYCNLKEHKIKKISVRLSSPFFWWKVTKRKNQDYYKLFFMAFHLKTLSPLHIFPTKRNNRFMFEKALIWGKRHLKQTKERRRKIYCFLIFITW